MAYGLKACSCHPLRPLQFTIMHLIEFLPRFLGDLNLGVPCLSLIGVDVVSSVGQVTITSDDSLKKEKEFDISRDALSNKELWKFGQPQM